MEQDPAFYSKFSKLIQQAIDDFRARRLSDLDYLNRVGEIRDKVVNRQHDDVPANLHGNDDAMAFYGVIRPYLMEKLSRRIQWTGRRGGGAGDQYNHSPPLEGALLGRCGCTETRDE